MKDICTLGEFGGLGDGPYRLYCEHKIAAARGAPLPTPTRNLDYEHDRATGISAPERAMHDPIFRAALAEAKRQNHDPARCSDGVDRGCSSQPGSGLFPMLIDRAKQAKAQADIRDIIGDIRKISGLLEDLQTESESFGLLAEWNAANDALDALWSGFQKLEGDS